MAPAILALDGDVSGTTAAAFTVCPWALQVMSGEELNRKTAQRCHQPDGIEQCAFFTLVLAAGESKRWAEDCVCRRPGAAVVHGG